jgi:hypothetical protein
VTTQYRCLHCGEIHDHKPLPGWCCVVDGHPVGLEPVVVLPLAEAEALLALKERVEDDALAKWMYDDHPDEWPTPGEHDAAKIAIAAYRARLRGET